MVLLRHISIALTAAVAAFGSALFIVLSHLFKRQVWTPEAKYYAIHEEEEEPREKQVLVLGLDGAGKSSVLQGLCADSTAALPGGQRCKPTRGFNFVRLSTPFCQLDFLEIGGAEDLRVYWADYLRRTHVLVYVVDSADRHRLPQARNELHRLLKANTRLPVVVLGNKQDKPGAISMPDLHDALSLASVSDTRQLLLIPAQTGTNGHGGLSGLQSFQDLLLKL